MTQRMTLDAFLVKLRDEASKTSVTELAKKYNINGWHIHMFLNHPNFIPSRDVRNHLNLVLKERPRRVAVHCTDLDSAYATLSSDSNFSRSFIRDLVDRLVTEYLVPFEV